MMPGMAFPTTAGLAKTPLRGASSGAGSVTLTERDSRANTWETEAVSRKHSWIGGVRRGGNAKGFGHDPPSSSFRQSVPGFADPGRFWRPARDGSRRGDGVPQRPHDS